MNPTNTPVLLIVFNRPDKVRRLIDALSAIRPTRLYVAADGPRPLRPDDNERCREVRELFSALPWPCEVITNFQDRNLGCRLGVSTAISWFFTKVEEGIILEDDCLPSPDFFTFATTLLEHYRHDETIMHIAGSTYLSENEHSHPSDSYWFSHVSLIWGWATWRRAWHRYDLSMQKLSDLETRRAIVKTFPKRSFGYFWLDLFTHIRDKKIDTWDAQWLYSITTHQGRAIIPSINLIENIGFDADATHTTEAVTHALRHGALPNQTLIHPKAVTFDEKAESILMYRGFLTTWYMRVRYALRAWL